MTKADYKKRLLRLAMRERSWVPVEAFYPPEDGEYITVTSNDHVEVLRYTKNLYKLDDGYSFPDMKGKKGFYFYDSEWGYILVDDVVAWQVMPPKYYPEVGSVWINALK